MNRQISTIARYTLLEAWRTRLPALALLAVVLLVGLAYFAAEIAVVEHDRLRTTFYAAGARLCAVFVAMLYVLVSITREFNDKGFDVVLALDLPRSHYILGRLAGFLAIGATLAVIVGLPLFALVGPMAAAQWTASLALELAIVMALALFCVMTFNQLLPAASFVAAFYLLARSLTAVRLMSAHPVGGGDTVSHQFMTWGIEALALAMPALDHWTRTAWLVNAAPAWSEIAALGAQSAAYVCLLTAAAAFDLYRKNF